MNTNSRQEWFAKRHQTLVWLREKFPLAFPRDPKPLKIGIHQDIFDSNLDDMPAKVWIRRSLCHYVKSYAYLNALVTGKERLDLQGMPTGQVSEQEATQAKNELSSRNRNNAKPVKQLKVSDIKESVCNSSRNITQIQDCIPENLVIRKVMTLKKKTNQ